jgi:hypothetical protein
MRKANTTHLCIRQKCVRANGKGKWITKIFTFITKELPFSTYFTLTIEEGTVDF